MNSRSKAAALSILVILALAGSSYLFGARKMGRRPATEQAYEGVLDLEPSSLLEPARLFDVHSIRLAKQIYSSLVAYDPQYSIVGDLAADWRISPDGKEYRFNLKPGLRFQDGTSVTASEVVACLRLLGERGSVRRDVWRYVESIGVGGDRVIVIRLKKKFSPFLDFLASPAAGICKNPEHPIPYRPVGAGPYMVSEWISGRLIVLVRNPYYYGPPPAIAIIRFHVVKGPDDVRDLLKTVRLHDLGWYNPDISAYKNDYIELDSPSLYVSGVFFNLSKPPFSALAFRREFVRVIDKKELMREVYPSGIIAKGYLPLGLLGHDNALPDSLYEPDVDSGLLRAYKKLGISY